MSWLFVENNLRFEVNEMDSMFNSSQIGSTNNKKTPIMIQKPTPAAAPPAPVKATNTSKSTKSASKSSRTSTTPKIPSNLVKSTLPSFSTNNHHVYQHQNHHNHHNENHDAIIIYDKQELMQFLVEREENLFKVRDQYEQQFETFFSLAKRFHTEKLNNLKLAFKNQMLKQQIYFETELLELSKECSRDYECLLTTNRNKQNQRATFKSFSSSSSSNRKEKLEQEKQIIKLCKLDMKKLVDYMREAIINSSDTLIEAYETCQILRTMEHIEANIQKQSVQLNASTAGLISKKQENDEKNINNEDDECSSQLNKQLNEEQIQFNKYKKEMDELMHILDDIELQHLQRKDQLTTKTKFFNKLKTKFKFIETKYDSLNKQISSLKYESFVYKQLLEEKDRSSKQNQENSSEKPKEETNCYSKSSLLSSLSPSSSSRSSSTSSLSDCIETGSSSANAVGKVDVESKKLSLSSSSSSLFNQDMSELIIASDDHIQLDDEYSFDSISHQQNIAAPSTKINNKTRNDSAESDTTLSLADYNRKLSILNDLINFHKTKACLQSNSEFMKANMKYFNLKDEENKNRKRTLSVSAEIEIEQLLRSCNLSDDSNLENEHRWQLKQSSLELSECSIDGEKVVVENCNLKCDRDLSGWLLTRQVEKMPASSYRFPIGSSIGAGKVLRVDAPFANDQLNYLLAIRDHYFSNGNNIERDSLNRICLKIKTKLVSPDGKLKAMHSQEIPQFYKEIYKYANMIKFL